jgi:Fur family peroxide stress response transcriptional regulator
MPIDDVLATLKERGYRLTPQRLAICRLIMSSPDHPSVERIYTTVKKEYPTMSLATVYKTMLLLKAEGFIQEVDTMEGQIRYDPNTDLHINLVCSRCSDIKDATSETLKGAWSEIIKETGIQPHGQLVNIYYLCEKCRAK